MKPPAKLERCPWARSPLMQAYHDTEWGVPVHDDRKLFEFLVLEGAQAGLSWETVLRKREAYREAFDNFDVQKVARYDARKIESLLRNPGIIRNRLKIASVVTNSRAFAQIQVEFGSFDAYIWRFMEGGKPLQNAWKSLLNIPSFTPISTRIAADLKQKGFKFVGTTIIYAHMQATGMVNDHLVTCPRHVALRR
jgi:DNA-3-methyladenine glycosylase I